MSCQTFLVFYFLLFVCCQLCEQGCAAQNSKAQGDNNNGNTVTEFFELKEEQIQEVVQSVPLSQEVTEINVNYVESVFLAAADGVMAALAEVSYTNYGNNNGDIILAKYIETTSADWVNETIKSGDAKKWKVKGTAKKPRNESKAAIKSFAAVAEQNKIYHITISNDILEDNVSSQPPTAKWHVRLVEGDVTAGSDGNGKTVNLKSLKTSLKDEDSQLKEKIKTELTALPPSDGFAFVSEDKIIFFMKAKDTADNNITAIFHLEKKENGNLQLLNVEDIDGCYPSFFQWGENVFMTPTSCPDKESYNVKMFDKTTNNFTESSEPIARLRDFFKDKKYFTTASINKTNVLLFTQEKNLSTKSKIVYLWMSDGTRVKNVGTIVDYMKIDKTFYGSLLHTKDELFALYRTYEAENSLIEENEFSLTLLKEQLEKIKKTLNTWKENNEKIKHLYKERTTTTNINFTDGIVGLLSGNGKGNNNNWEDEYLYVNATVTTSEKKRNARKTDNGFKFTGTGAGAMWPVGKAGNDQLYNFTDPGFTLVANVTVGNGTNRTDNSILGLSLGDKNNTVGLWCTTYGKWGVKVGNVPAQISSSEINCTHDETYYVTLILNESKKIFVYVNGQQLTELNNNKMKIGPTQKIDYFYFGAYNHLLTIENTDVTVTNVLLYNRPFTADEGKELKPKNDRETSQTAIEKYDNNTLEHNKSTTENDTKRHSPPPTTEDSAARVGVVGVLCFMLFGVFTLLGRYVY